MSSRKTSYHSKYRRRRHLKGLKAFFSRRSVVITLIVLGLMVIGGLIFLKNGKPLVHAYRANRAAVSARKAVAELDAGNLAKAAEFLREALKLESTSTREVPEVRRSYAILSTRTGRHEDAVKIWDRLEQRGELTVDDTMYYLESLIAQGKTSESQRLIGRLDQEGLEHPRLASMRAALAITVGDKENAIDLLRAAAEQDTDNARIRLELGKRLVSSKSNKERAEGWPILKALASGKDRSVARAAVGLLQRGKQLTPEDARAILNSQNVGEGPDAFSYGDAFVLMANAMGADKLEAFLEEEIPKAAAQGLTDRVLISGHLRQIRQYARILELLPEADSQRHPLARAFRIEAIGRLQGWDTALTTLEHEAEADDPLADILRAFIAKESGQPQASAAAELLKAVESAEKKEKYQILLIIAEFARSVEENALELDVLIRGLKYPDVAEVCLDRLLTVHRGDPVRLPMDSILARIPPAIERGESGVPLERWLYLRLLTRTYLDDALAEAKTAVEQQPTNSFRRLLLGWALRNKGNLTESNQELSQVSADLLPPGPRAIFSRLAERSGEPGLIEKGRTAKAGIDAQNLLPEEIQFVTAL